jgi:hypothetical protein
MTKAVRIENADNGTDYQVVVQTWAKGYEKDGEIEPDTMVKEEVLWHPTQMVDGLIHDSQYLVVKEKTES